MPIRFRCPQCGSMLGIAKRKAGQPTTCPQCRSQVLVPSTDLDEIDDLVNPAAVAVPAVPAHANGMPAAIELPPAPPAAPARPTIRVHPPGKSRRPGDEPLIQGDVDALLGLRTRPAAQALDLDDAEPAAGQPRGPRPVSGRDALSIADDQRPFLLSPRNATLLAVVVVVLLALAFAAGYLIGHNTHTA